MVNQGGPCHTKLTHRDLWWSSAMTALLAEGLRACDGLAGMLLDGILLGSVSLGGAYDT